ncbi:protein arginine N-methyltransferase 7-like [Sycon ciliatum]|uniref:protein arginine N-methyltransferase 7-like n=1 Tax=Sycon ciliatum TaxID=27933 RepID=UPI0031F63C20
MEKPVPGSVLRSQFNPLTGAMEWTFAADSEGEDHETAQDVARSQYGDMLHDHERNVLYERAIDYAVTDVCRQFLSSPGTGDAGDEQSQQHVHVLDIGAGTGLLSMMAARRAKQEHADVLVQGTAVEAYAPMARIAEKCIKTNGFEKQISLIDRRSTDVSADSGAMPQRAQLLVTEVFDSELIGEGGLYTIFHAFENMLTPDAAVVPASALCYVQLISSEWLASCQSFSSLQAQWQSHTSSKLALPDGMASCRGPPCGYDLHVERLWDTDDITLMSDASLIQTFELDSMKDLEQYCKNPRPATSVMKVLPARKKTGPASSGSGSGSAVPCHGVVFWWDLLMHRGTDIVLSMAPSWHRQGTEKPQWREHWMPVVFLLPEPILAEEGDQLAVDFAHDEYSIWFDIRKIVNPSPEATVETALSVERPLCRCGAHTTWTRERCSDINDPAKMTAWSHVLREIPTTASVCLYLGSPSFLPLLCATLNPNMTVYAVNVSSSISNSRLMSGLIESNQLTERVHWINSPAAELKPSHIGNKTVDVLISEPFFSTSILPWHDLAFLFLKNSLSTLLSPECIVLPQRGSIMAAPVHFTDFWKMRAPVGTVCKFDLSEFDVYTETTPTIGKDGRVCYQDVESFGVWEFESYLLAPPQSVLTFDFCSPVTQQKSSGDVLFKTESGKPCNAVVFWMDFDLSDNNSISTGLQPVPAPSDDVEPVWVRGQRQGVVFLSNAKRLDESPPAANGCSDARPVFSETFSVSAELQAPSGQFTVTVT